MEGNLLYSEFTDLNVNLTQTTNKQNSNNKKHHLHRNIQNNVWTYLGIMAHTSWHIKWSNTTSICPSLRSHRYQEVATFASGSLLLLLLLYLLFLLLFFLLLLLYSCWRSVLKRTPCPIYCWTQAYPALMHTPISLHLKEQAHVSEEPDLSKCREEELWCSGPISTSWNQRSDL